MPEQLARNCLYAHGKGAAAKQKVAAAPQRGKTHFWHAKCCLRESDEAPPQISPKPGKAHDQKTCAGDAQPAAGALEDGLSSGFYQLDDVGVQTDGRHGHNDKELNQFLHRREEAGENAQADGYGSDDGGSDKIENKGGKFG